MSKATERRERRLSERLAQLAHTNPYGFKKQWQQLLATWSAEAYRRGNCLCRDEVAASPQLPVFGVLEKAKRLLALCGEEAERLVGAVTRDFIKHDCAKAFAMAVDPQMYWLSKADRNHPLMRFWTHRAPR